MVATTAISMRLSGLRHDEKFTIVVSNMTAMTTARSWSSAVSWREEEAEAGEEANTASPFVSIVAGCADGYLGVRGRIGRSH